MDELKPGSLYPQDVIGQQREPELSSGGIWLNDTTLVIGTFDPTVSHFCVRQERDGANGEIRIDAHFDWHHIQSELPDSVPGRKLSVFRQDGDQLRYLGLGHVGMAGFGGAEGAQIQVDLLELPTDVAESMTPAAPQPMDGPALASALEERGCDRLPVAERFIDSWIGPLPEPQPVPESQGAPKDVRRWHALWSRLNPLHQFPYCCWPASWSEPDEEGIQSFQDEWQNGGTFGWREGAVWIDKWVNDGDQSVRCAEDVGEFALQFLIYGMTQGAFGRFINVDDATNRIPSLPIGGWPAFFGIDVAFVGEPGGVGIRSEGKTTLCVASW